MDLLVLVVNQALEVYLETRLWSMDPQGNKVPQDYQVYRAHQGMMEPQGDVDPLVAKVTEEILVTMVDVVLLESRERTVFQDQWVQEVNLDRRDHLEPQVYLVVQPKAKLYLVLQGPLVRWDLLDPVGNLE